MAAFKETVAETFLLTCTIRVLALQFAMTCYSTFQICVLSLCLIRQVKYGLLETRELYSVPVIISDLYV